MYKKIMSMCICFMLISTPVLTSAATNDKSEEGINLESQETIKTITITGKVFSYKDAPEDIKNEYEKNCEIFGIIPQDMDEIIIPTSEFKQFAITESSDNSRIAYTVSFDGTNISVQGSKNYSFNIYNTYVGYNYITSGNPVHCLQLLLNEFQASYGQFSPLTMDSIFGPSTQQALGIFQRYAGLSVDSVAGPNTWKSLINYTT